MPTRLPGKVDPWRLADSGARFSGRFPLSLLRRLTTMLAAVAGDVTYDLEFFRDPQRRVCISARLRTNLLVTCQRCLQPMAIPMDLRPLYAMVVSGAQMDQLPDPLEPVQVEDGLLELLDLLEDELILAIPQVPVHEVALCPVKLQQPGERASEAPTPRDENPFAVLARLKQKME